MEQLPVAVVRWALGEGRPLIAQARTALADGDTELAVGTRLRDRIDPERAAFVMQAAVARARAVEAGVAEAEQLVLTREALEQASHPDVAAWRAGRAAWARDTADSDQPLQDRCAGSGADAVAMAVHAPVVAVERDAGRALLAEDRARVLGRDVTVVVGDALDTAVVTPAGAVVHADPDRRDERGRRARTLAQHRPGVAALTAALRGAVGTLLTVAPGVAWDDPDLPPDVEVVFVQHGQRLVEAVLCGGAAVQGAARARAVLLPEGHERARTDEPATAPVGDVGGWLLEVAPAAVRARLHDALALEHGAVRLARRRALLSTHDDPGDAAWYRRAPVEAVLPARPRALRDHLRGEDRPVELLLHGVDVDPRSFLRAAGNPRTGPNGLRVHLVRRDDDAIAIVTGPTAG